MHLSTACGVAFSAGYSIDAVSLRGPRRCVRVEARRRYRVCVRAQEACAEAEAEE